MVCMNLYSLDLRNNSIDDEGMITLTECVPELFRIPRLKGFKVSIIYMQDPVDLRGNPVSEELILTCNEQLKVLTLYFMIMLHLLK